MAAPRIVGADERQLDRLGRLHLPFDVVGDFLELLSPVSGYLIEFITPLINVFP